MKAMNRLTHIRQLTFDVLEHRDTHIITKILGRLLVLTILISVGAAIFETVSVLYEQYRHVFMSIEIISVSIFVVEYLLRLWTAPLHKDYTTLIRFMMRPSMIFDALVILPALILPFVPNSVDARVLRTVRILRIIRLFSTGRFSDAIERAGRVLNKEKEGLLSAFALIFVLLLIASSLLYLVEHNVSGSLFTSIPQSLYWGVITLTTVGYGDMVPQTEIGQALAAMIALLNIGALALPTSILGASFYSEITHGRDAALARVTLEVDEIEKEMQGIESEMEKMESEVREVRDNSSREAGELHNFVRKNKERMERLDRRLRTLEEVSRQTKDK